MRIISTAELIVVSVSVGLVAGMLTAAYVVLTGRWQP